MGEPRHPSTLVRMLLRKIFVKGHVLASFLKQVVVTEGWRGRWSRWVRWPSEETRVEHTFPKTLTTGVLVGATGDRKG